MFIELLVLFDFHLAQSMLFGYCNITFHQMLFNYQSPGL